MKVTFLSILILVSVSLVGQSYIGLNKTDCHSQVNKMVKENGFTSFYQETESSLVFSISRSLIPYLTLTIYFKQGISNIQTQSYSCDTCMYYAYQKIIQNKIYSWKKNKDGSLYSTISKGIMLDIPKDTFLRFRIRKN